MNTHKNLIQGLKQGVLQRLQFIEILAYYTGVVTRADVARAFGISDAAATKDLNLYGQIAPGNLAYKHSLFGFVPTPGFIEQVSSFDAAMVLNMIAGNVVSPGFPIADTSLYGVTAEFLPLPVRLPAKPVLTQIVRAIKGQQKLSIRYHSLSDREAGERRRIEPHSLVHTGLRWHVRGYNEQTFDFRDFVLSRITEAELINESAESSQQYDDDWVEYASVILSPHPGLDPQKRKNLAIDFGAEGETFELKVRRALTGYLLQRLAVDTTSDHSLNPSAYQLVVTNRDEIEPFAGWAFY